MEKFKLSPWETMQELEYVINDLIFEVEKLKEFQNNLPQLFKEQLQEAVRELKEEREND